MTKFFSYFFRILSICCLVFLFHSCGSTLNSFSFDNIPDKPDYRSRNNWAVLPSKYTKELKTLLIDSISQLKADVFYVYPTLITSKKDHRWNVSVTDEKQNEKVINVAVRYQASAWATSGKLYVPFYRQAHIRSYSNLENGGKKALLLAYQDIKSAFEVYLKEYNKGRPIIIASHSQGTTHARLLLKDFFDSKPLQKRLIAAYIPGIGINKNEFETIPIMTKPYETGGFVSWNTYKKRKLPKKYNEWFKNKVTSNPITWDNTKETNKNHHKGFLYRNGNIYDKALKIEVIDGLIWTTLPRFPHSYFVLFKKNYHAGDINLFWKDIQENAELRVKTWIKNNKN